MFQSPTADLFDVWSLLDKWTSRLVSIYLRTGQIVVLAILDACIMPLIDFPSFQSLKNDSHKQLSDLHVETQGSNRELVII